MFEIEPFQIFGTDHLSVLIFILSLSILFPYFLRNQSETIKTRFGQGLAVLLITNELLKPFIYSSVWPEDFPFLKMLPMHFCHLASFSGTVSGNVRKNTGHGLDLPHRELGAQIGALQSAISLLDFAM